MCTGEGTGGSYYRDCGWLAAAHNVVVGGGDVVVVVLVIVVVIGVGNEMAKRGIKLNCMQQAREAVHPGDVFGGGFETREFNLGDSVKDEDKNKVLIRCASVSAFDGGKLPKN